MNQKLTYRCGGSEGIINALSGNAPISQFHLVCRKQTWHLTTSANYIANCFVRMKKFINNYLHML